MISNDKIRKFFNFIKDKWKTFGYCFLISFVMLMLCSKCSFLYPFNGWDDFNSFYTVGSGWANGLLPYRDLFEQKGPLLYLIFMIGYLISPEKFSGVFVLEVIFLTFTLYFSSKIIDLFIDNKKDKRGKYLILLLYGIMITTSVSFVDGGSSEEFNLLFVTISIFYLIKYLKNDRLENISYRDLIICGLCCGCSLMIKYTPIGLWFMMMTVICIKLLKLRRFKDAIIKGFVFVISMIIPLFGFMIYFYFNHGLYDFLNTYFYINIFRYSLDLSFLENILSVCKNIFAAFFSNIPLVIIFYILFCYYLYRKWKFNCKIRIDGKHTTFLGIVLFTLIVSYWGQEFRPYAFTVVFFIVLLIIIYVYRIFYNNRLFKIGCLIYILITFVFGIDYKYMLTSKEEIVQYRFAEIINKEENPTILQYRSIDEGFYTVAGVMPQNKYFEQVNMSAIDLPESYSEQDRIIKNKEVMFVIVRKFDMTRGGGYMDLVRESKELFNKKASLDFINNYYELVDEYENHVGYYNSCNYYLFKARD